MCASPHVREAARPVAVATMRPWGGSEPPGRSQHHGVTTVEVRAHVEDDLPAFAEHDIGTDVVDPLRVRLLVGFEAQRATVTDIDVPLGRGGRVPATDAQPDLE